MSRKLPLFQLNPSFNTPEIQGHTLRQSFFLGHYIPLGRKITTLNYSFSSQCCMWWNAQHCRCPRVQSPGREAKHQSALHSVWFTRWAHCPCSFCCLLTTTTKSWTLPIPSILTTVAGSNCHGLHCPLPALTMAPYHSWDKAQNLRTGFQCPPHLMPTCLLFHSPWPSPQMCACTHTCTHARAHTIHKGSFCFGQATSPWFPQETMNSPPPVTSATHLRLPSHQLEPEAWYGASVTTCPSQSSKDHHCPPCSWGACFGACWVGGGNSKLRWQIQMVA